MTAGLDTGPGNTRLDPDELAQLIPSLSTKGQLDEWERRNILEAYDWALNPRAQRKRDPFDERYVRELHRRMFNRTWKWAGTYRSSEKNIGVPFHEIRNRIPALLADARYWSVHKTYPPDEIAVRFHYVLVGVIHPFPNGNGRHGRLHADVIAVKLGRPAFSWGQNDIGSAGSTRETYLHALQAADAGNILPLLEFARS
jgi:Fic-DOC domain mobile mystery protein B